MKYATAADFKMALQERLRTEARKRPEFEIQRRRKQIVFERFLARLSTVQPEDWVLKGGALLELRMNERARSTQDLDLATTLDEDELIDVLLAAAAADLEDWFSFSIARTGVITDHDDVMAIRFRLTALVGEQRFEIVPVDVGVGNPLTQRPDMLEERSLLDFAGIPSVRYPALPLSQHLAEKLHAYARVYAGGRSSSRIKDLVDIVLIVSEFTFDSMELLDRIQATFIDRDSHPVPEKFPNPPDFWAPGYRVMAGDIGLEPDVSMGHRIASSFFDPLLAGELPEGARWSREMRMWLSEPG